VTIWTADRRDHTVIQRALGSLREGVRLATRTVPEAGTVVCYDPPSPLELAQMSAVGEVVLLVPPGAEAYVQSLAPKRRPMQLDSPAAAVLDRDAGLREQIAGALEHGDNTAALYALAPLFERSDPQLVAAAVFGLWRAAVGAGAAPVPTAGGPGQTASGAQADAPRSVSASSGIAKLWIGAGKKDEATVGDFVAVLIKEAGMERARIGRIELRDTFALVEVPAEDAEGIAQRLVGLTIRKRKLSARVDRGRGGGRSKDRG
jgi:ATP-dependent RNA helicase DeaD